MSDQMFEKASRNKYRFPFKGPGISVEDLWALTDEQLDAVYQALRKDHKVANEDSLRGPKVVVNDELTTKIAIVRHIFEVKETEKKAREDAAKRREQKAKLLEIIARKEDTALEGKSPEELRKMLDDLG